MTQATYIEAAEVDTLANQSMPVVIDFTATWCGPCRMVAPLVDRLAEDYQDRAKVFKLDVDNNKEMAKRFGIKSIPVVLVLKEGQAVEKIVGVKDYEVFSNAVETHL